MASLVLSVLLTVIVAWFLLKPFLVALPAANASTAEDLKSLRLQKTRCLELLRDLENDHAAGKMTDNDYAETRQRLRSELAILLRRLDLSAAVN
jgi:hypothetical protein